LDNLNLKILNQYNDEVIEKVTKGVKELQEERDKLKQQIIQSKDLNHDLSVRIGQYYNLI